MVKAQKKTGKGRLDKYYKLAKEQGYRARSAFKLIQLNKKYAFLESARCCVDLCAAPGGWLQVASKYMPTNSVIVGVDLVPIKPIPRVVTFAADITTIHCRNLLRGELKDWKADVVLHDGAPNVGTAWVQDAYSQSELVLMSLKLAVEFLVKGGTFVTKVFRSVDYNNLIWVFSQLFAKVEATKPPSSRNVSAEIFVVCREFLAPKHIDPKFLDPKHVFKDLAALPGPDKGSSANNAMANVFQPEKKRRRRDGYDDGDYTLFTKASASDFVRSLEPINVLGLANTILFETDEEKQWLEFVITTPDVKANFEDLKVLGKGDFKALLKWGRAVREELGLDTKTRPAAELTEPVEVSEVVDEEQQLQEELEKQNAEATAKAKRARRRSNEIKTKTIQRLQLQMTAPLDIGLDQNDASLSQGQDDIFDLLETQRELHKTGGISQLASDNEMPSDEEDEAAEENDGQKLVFAQENDRRVSMLEADLDSMYHAYREKAKAKDAKQRVLEAREKACQPNEWNGLQNEKNVESDDDSSENGGWEEMAAAKETCDFSSEESDYDESIPGRKRKRPYSSIRKDIDTQPPSRAAQIWFGQDIFKDIAESIEGSIKGDVDLGVDEEMASGFESQRNDQEEKSEASDFEIVPAESGEDVTMWSIEDENVDQVKQAYIQKCGLTRVGAVTLAQQLVNRRTTKTRLLDDGFNRYSLNSKDGLPAWFLDDEAKHYKPNIPVTKEAVSALRARQRALDSRPIKKIAEAKGRKKLRAAQRLEKAMKKAEGVNATTDMSEQEKAQQIEKLMRKGFAKGKKKEVRVVVAKGVHKGIKGRPKGVKGRYAMVDARMRKEVRAKKRSDRARSGHR